MVGEARSPSPRACKSKAKVNTAYFEGFEEKGPDMLVLLLDPRTGNRPSADRHTLPLLQVQSAAKMVMNSEQIGDRNSSRVLAAPGGRSDMASLLGGYSAPAPAPAPRVVAAPPSSNNPEDMPVAGQRIELRTEHTGITAHSSSRVLAAPGGRSDMASLLSGGGGVIVCCCSNPAPPSPLAANTHSSLTFTQESSPSSLSAQAPAQVPVARHVPAPTAPVAGQQLAAGQRVVMRTEFSGIETGHASSRVLAVPGGQSDMASIMSGGANSSASDRIAALKAKRQANPILGDSTNAVGF